MQTNQNDKKQFYVIKRDYKQMLCFSHTHYIQKIRGLYQS